MPIHWAIFAAYISLVFAQVRWYNPEEDASFADFKDQLMVDFNISAIDTDKMPIYRAPLIIPALGTHTATVFFLHGLGDTGHGWADIVKVIQAKGRLNEVRFVLPHAPTRSITVNGGLPAPAWFDTRSLAMGAGLMNPDDIGDTMEDEAGMLESRQYIHSLIENETERNGIAPHRIVLGGFSQGGAMSIFAGLTSPVRLAGIVGLSCWLVLRTKFQDLVPKENVNKETPVFLAQGDEDIVILPEWAKETQQILNSWDYKVDLKMYSGLEHSAAKEEIDNVEEFFASKLPPKGDNVVLSN